jgi:hypothetical protein
MLRLAQPWYAIFKALAAVSDAAAGCSDGAGISAVA